MSSLPGHLSPIRSRKKDQELGTRLRNDNFRSRSSSRLRMVGGRGRLVAGEYYTRGQGLSSFINYVTFTARLPNPQRGMAFGFSWKASFAMRRRCKPVPPSDKVRGLGSNNFRGAKIFRRWSQLARNQGAGRLTSPSALHRAEYFTTLSQHFYSGKCLASVTNTKDLIKQARIADSGNRPRVVAYWHWKTRHFARRWTQACTVVATIITLDK